MSTRERNLLFFDCETGDLDPMTSDMIEVAAVVTDWTGETILEEFDAKVFPMLSVNPEAAGVNGYDVGAWAHEAVDQAIIVPRVLALARECIFVGHNPTFDWTFLMAAARRLGIPWDPNYHHRKVDTVSLMWPLLMDKRVDAVKLGPCLEYFGITNIAPHTARGDVHACRELFLAQMKLYRGRRMGCTNYCTCARACVLPIGHHSDHSCGEEPQ